MASIIYSEIQSRFMVRVEAYDIAALSDDIYVSFINDWVHSALSKQHIMNLFTEISIDDDIQTVTYELEHPSAIEQSDKDFVITILAYDCILAWLDPQIKSLKNTQQVFGSKEEKFYSQREHLLGLRALYQDVLYEQKSLIADRNAMLNSYLQEA